LQAFGVQNCKAKTSKLKRPQLARFSLSLKLQLEQQQKGVFVPLTLHHPSVAATRTQSYICEDFETNTLVSERPLCIVEPEFLPVSDKDTESQLQHFEAKHTNFSLRT
jgi:hypothetical protein